MADPAIREQFGAHATEYVDNPVHARGASLARLVERVPARPDWHALDVATGAGHTAFAFAPRVAHVRATDITPEMLDLARQGAAERGLANVVAEPADAEALPYPDASFDLVTCRIAPHHFADVDRFVGEAARVLRPGGVLAIADNIVPAGPGGDYVNALEKLRDPSHARCLCLDEWLGTLAGAGLSLLAGETLEKAIQFDRWAARHDPTLRRYLRALLDQATGAAAAHLHPRVENGALTFHLLEGVLVARR